MTQNSLSPGKTYLRLLGYTKKYRVFFYIAVFGLLLQALANGFFVQQVEPLVQDVFESRDPEAIVRVPLVIFMAILVRAIGTIIGGYFMDRVSWSIIKNLREEVFAKYLNAPTTFFDLSSSGTQISKITFNITQVSTTASNAITTVIRDGLTAIVLVAIMISISWQLLLVFLAVIPIMFVCIEVANKASRRYSRRIQNSIGQVAHSVGQVLDSHRVIKVFNGAESEINRFDKINSYNFKQEMKFSVVKNLISPFTQILVGLSLAGIVYLAASDLIGEPMTAGSFMAFFFALGGLFAPLKSLTKVNVQIQQGITAAQDVFAVIDSPAETDEGVEELDAANSDINIKSLSFKYAGAEEPAIKDLNLTIKTGQTVALVGQSGSGKTTVASLLPRFYDPSEGSIEIGAKDIREYSLHSLRSQISYVGQDSILFDDTIRNNIAYAAMEAKSEDELMSAIKAARADVFIKDIPEGLDAPVGEGGALLSGGQRQRISIARAILKDAPILILDEATSALDTESERFIQAALDELIQDRTTLVIAHRLSTIENADKIVVMNNGEIVEQGTHDELLLKKGAYSKLHALQFGSED